MRLILSAFLLVILLGATSGCAAVSGFPKRSLDLKAEQAVLAPYLKPQVITNFTATSDAARGGLSKRAYRDEVLEARIRDADLRFAAFERTLYSEGIGFGVGTDWMALAANAYGAVTNNNGRSMAVLATTITGAKGAVDREAFYDRTLPVIMAQMVARRKTVLVAIRTGQGQNETDYSLFRGLSDLEDYERAGSIPGALSQLSATVGEENQAAEQDLKSIRVKGPVAASLQARKRQAATYVRGLSPADLARLYDALPAPKPADPLTAALAPIAAAATESDFQSYVARLTVLFGVNF